MFWMQCMLLIFVKVAKPKQPNLQTILLSCYMFSSNLLYAKIFQSCHMFFSNLLYMQNKFAKYFSKLSHVFLKLVICIYQSYHMHSLPSAKLNLLKCDHDFGACWSFNSAVEWIWLLNLPTLFPVQQFTTCSKCQLELSMPGSVLYLAMLSRYFFFMSRPIDVGF